MKAKIAAEPTANLPGVSERHSVHILNPFSGGKNAKKYYEAARRAIEKIGGEILVSEHSGHITEITADVFRKDPFAHAVIYGGDGTVNEAVNGIMLSGHADTASFSVIPQGSGNDFAKYVNDPKNFERTKLMPLDLIKVTCGENVRYFANTMNIGFDCDVVLTSYKVKKFPILQGSLAYIASVVATLAKKKTIHASIKLSGCVDFEGAPIDDVMIERDILLTEGANSRFCGGGFYSAPLASVSDGLMDVLVVNNVSIPKFASLVGAYHDGTYIDDHGNMPKKFDGIISYHRCRKFELGGAEHFGLDGEVFATNGECISAEVIPHATLFAAL
ncbi:MAG: hypothetical protein E7672_06835 [Ruminococcaceae bacterium]|nr:hypothetical protein [Oscillospiraceae bacterium]